MAAYSGAWKVIKSMMFGVAAAFFVFIIYIIAGSKMGYITSECVEYVDVIDIISVDDNQITILTNDGELVVKNAKVTQGKNGYCADWESVEEWRDGE